MALIEGFSCPELTRMVQVAQFLLARNKPTLVARFGVDRLALFGSTARDAARADSDIDILVSFDGPATSAGPVKSRDVRTELARCG